MPTPQRKRSDFAGAEEAWLRGGTDDSISFNASPRRVRVLDPQTHGPRYLSVEDKDGSFGIALKDVYRTAAEAEVAMCEQTVKLQEARLSLVAKKLASSQKDLAKAQARLAKETAAAAKKAAPPMKGTARRGG